MEVKYLYIEPLDTLFFRTGRPFDKGEESWADPSLVLPNPSVIWGAIFSSLMSEKEVTKDEKNALILIQYWLFHDETKQIFIPAPLDLFYEDGNDSYWPEKYDSSEYNNSNGKVEKLTRFYHDSNTEIKVENNSGMFIRYVDFIESYYKRQTGRTTIYHQKEFALHAPKIGISRDKSSRTAAEGQLYKTELIELGSGWGFLVKIETNKNLKPTGIIRLGGEGKMARYEILHNTDSIDNMLSDKSTLPADMDSFKLILLSPTFWESGDGIKDLAAKNLSVISACIGKYQSIGGYDIARNEPKPMRRAVPAGSVYRIGGNPDTDKVNIIKELIKEANNPDGFGAFQIIPLRKINS